MTQFLNFDPGTDARAIAQLERCLSLEEGAKGALMADAHLGYSMPIGGVIAFRDLIIPAGVGYDQGCGNLAVRTNLIAKEVDIPKVMDEVWRVLSFGMGQRNGEEVKDAEVFNLINKCSYEPFRKLLPAARQQLGTIGSGNHYVDLFEDRKDGALWVGVHFGSRGLGHKTTTGMLSLAGGGAFGDHAKEGGMESIPLSFKASSSLGSLYQETHEICLAYAYEGREWVVRRIVEGILGAKVLDLVHNHHNALWREFHSVLGDNNTPVWVVRKGATPAFPGQRGFVGGTMGEDAVILEGAWESARSAEGLRSTVHGAGRAMSRTEAAGKVKWRKTWACTNYRACSFVAPLPSFHRGKENSLPLCPQCGHKLRTHDKPEVVRAGKIDWPAVQGEMRALGIELRGAGADEAPLAYKRLPDVLALHADTINILHLLRPIGVAMAGPDTHDPFKD